MSKPKPSGIPIGVALVVGFSVLLANVSESAGASGPISWRSDLGAARAEAESKGVALWLQFTGPWCPSCERMERETFPHPWVTSRSRSDFIPVKLRCDVNERLIEQFRITGIPATIILDPSGQVVARNEGYLDPAQFVALLDRAAGRVRLMATRHVRPAILATARHPVAEPPHETIVEPSTSSETRLALRGYCPVSLVVGRQLVPGLEQIQLRHQGRTYRFTSEDARDRFERQPERFIPMNSGLCPIAQVDAGEVQEGSPRYCVLYLGHLYLCTDEPSRQRFLTSPERYARVDVADRGLCPHCAVSAQLLAPNRPSTSILRDGSRVLFPDLGLLEAQRTATIGITRR